ncbi:MAG: division/cell wall cluster transcriptional repressor MraZ [Actinomycetota bacterium]|nr:division/cell wall cluster transcriptional repressor MraZ [Actinomycetota bacterium]
MFLGEHSHSLDSKGRIILPARFREDLAVAYVTSEVDGCLGIWPPEDFQQRAREMKERSKGSEEDRNVARFFFAGAQESNPDKNGRIALPQHLREFAHLTKDVVVNGAFDHVEIWDAGRWRERKASGERALSGTEQP